MPNPVDRDADGCARPLPGGIFYLENAGVVVHALATLEHAAYLRRRKETLPELFVPYLLGKLPQDLRRLRERLARLPVLPALLVKLAYPALVRNPVNLLR